MGLPAHSSGCSFIPCAVCSFCELHSHSLGCFHCLICLLILVAAVSFYWPYYHSLGCILIPLATCSFFGLPFSFHVRLFHNCRHPFNSFGCSCGIPSFTASTDCLLPRPPVLFLSLVCFLLSEHFFISSPLPWVDMLFFLLQRCIIFCPSSSNIVTLLLDVSPSSSSSWAASTSLFTLPVLSPVPYLPAACTSPIVSSHPIFPQPPVPPSRPPCRHESCLSYVVCHCFSHRVQGQGGGAASLDSVCTPLSTPRRAEQRTPPQFPFKFHPSFGPCSCQYLSHFLIFKGVFLLMISYYLSWLDKGSSIVRLWSTYHVLLTTTRNGRTDLPVIPSHVNNKGTVWLSVIICTISSGGSFFFPYHLPVLLFPLPPICFLPTFASCIVSLH